MKNLSMGVFIAIVTIPALVIGAGLWLLAGLVPACGNTISKTLAAPGASVSVVIFERDCGATTGLNTQAAIVPAGQTLDADATGFLSIGGTHDLAPAWNGAGNLELSLPTGSQIYRQETSVDGITVIYR